MRTLAGVHQTQPRRFFGSRIEACALRKKNKQSLLNSESPIDPKICGHGENDGVSCSVHTIKQYSSS